MSKTEPHPPIPAAWTERFKSSSAKSPLNSDTAEQTLISCPLTLRQRDGNPFFPLYEEVFLEQSLLPEMIVTVEIKSGTSGTLRAYRSDRKGPVTRNSGNSYTFGNLFLELKEILALCGGEPISFSFRENI
jgi:hypothetical protein